MKTMLIIAALLATVAATASDAAARDDEPQAPRGMLKVSPR